MRLIDADFLLRTFDRIHTELELKNLVEKDGTSALFSKIDFEMIVGMIPTADAVPRERFDRVMDNLKAVLAERENDESN